MKYAFMDKQSGNFQITAMSRVFQVSRSGFYAWRKRKYRPSRRKRRQQQLDALVEDAFHTRKGRYGAPRLTLDLADAGHHHDRKTVANSLRRQGLRAKAARKFKATTNARHNLPVAPNLLEQDFTATAPNQKYVSDITWGKIRHPHNGAKPKQHSFLFISRGLTRAKRALLARIGVFHCCRVQ